MLPEDAKFTISPFFDGNRILGAIAKTTVDGMTYSIFYKIVDGKPKFWGNEKSRSTMFAFKDDELLDILDNHGMRYQLVDSYILDDYDKKDA